MLARGWGVHRSDGRADQIALGTFVCYVLPSISPCPPMRAARADDDSNERRRGEKGCSEQKREKRPSLCKRGGADEGYCADIGVEEEES